VSSSTAKRQAKLPYTVTARGPVFRSPGRYPGPSVGAVLHGKFRCV
jgi:hypothetical protein